MFFTNICICKIPKYSHVWVQYKVTKQLMYKCSAIVDLHLLFFSYITATFHTLDNH